MNSRILFFHSRSGFSIGYSYEKCKHLAGVFQLHAEVEGVLSFYGTYLYIVCLVKQTLAGSRRQLHSIISILSLTVRTLFLWEGPDPSDVLKSLEELTFSSCLELEPKKIVFSKWAVYCFWKHWKFLYCFLCFLSFLFVGCLRLLYIRWVAI